MIIFITMWFTNYKRNMMPLTDLRRCFLLQLACRGCLVPRSRLGTASLETGEPCGLPSALS